VERFLPVLIMIGHIKSSKEDAKFARDTNPILEKGFM
jgi:hypothetical protein